MERWPNPHGAQFNPGSVTKQLRQRTDRPSSIAPGRKMPECLAGARVEATLQTKVAAAEAKPRGEPDVKARDEDMVKEIQRLKDELAKANDELERIKKRLASPKP